jgi:hypothetical protein
VTADSAPARGSTFSFTVPVADPVTEEVRP